MRESGDPELEAELEATRQRAVAELRGVGGGNAVPNDALIRELAKVISDPGSVIPRAAIGPYRGEYETVPTWAARAVLASLPRLGATVDTAPEGEVLEADDTVPVERLAHWLHGEFDMSAENSDLLPWAQEREGVKDRYRSAARALMSQLPELFR